MLEIFFSGPGNKMHKPVCQNCSNVYPDDTFNNNISMRGPIRVSCWPSIDGVQGSESMFFLIRSGRGGLIRQHMEQTEGLAVSIERADCY